MSTSLLLTHAGDETRPVCKACSKKNRPCQWEGPQNKFKSYQPEGSSGKAAASDADAGSDTMDVDDQDDGERESRSASVTRPAINRRDSRPESRSDAQSSATSYQGSQHSPHDCNDGSSFAHFSRNSRQSSTSNVSRTLQRPQIPPGTRPYSQNPIPLSHDEAVLVHHYTEHLGRWLDCTDATRQFTLGVPEKVKICPVLCHAVLSFAARHCKQEDVAEAAYQRCIALLIDRLNEDAASHDETLLCAIVILRFYEQLSGKNPQYCTKFLSS
jgi:hypothetical protein